MKSKDVVLVIIQFVLLVVFAIIPAGSISGFVLQVVSFIITIAGIVIVLIALLNLGKNLTPLPTPKKQSELITSGLFKYIRHPVYTGILVILAGISLYSLNIPRFGITVFVYLLFRYKAVYEEELLIKKFDAYKTYLKTTGRFIPTLK